ncbi:MAG: hypothetical protein H6531_00595 [Actinobacteria bacterium]|nr:hypothetical protein [Thermoleophilia bacterium]MCB9010313.1 hypothetical protein [Actinomycetota bacterium]
MTILLIIFIILALLFGIGGALKISLWFLLLLLLAVVAGGWLIRNVLSRG